ncbi:MAG: energy transducer TonB [Candidatus Kapabacteria bacterium]|nr:energy transducer TonB [Candidatus Kapabacteria bacterium]
MSTLAVEQASAGNRYGAAELKEIISRNTVRAFVYVSSTLLLLLLLRFTYDLVQPWLFPKPEIVRVKLVKASLDALPPPPSDQEAPPPPPPETSLPAGPAARAGTPVAVPDAMLAPDAKDFANIDEINRASAIGGSGVDDGGFAGNIGEYQLNITEREEVPDVDEFVAVEKEPGFDYDALRRRVRYPDMAMRAGIEGRVQVAALIGKDGRVMDIKITDSDNTILNDAAVKAVKDTPFTPAIQNGNPVVTWVRIPIVFELK